METDRVLGHTIDGPPVRASQLHKIFLRRIGDSRIAKHAHCPHDWLRGCRDNSEVFGN